MPRKVMINSIERNGRVLIIKTSEGSFGYDDINNFSEVILIGLLRNHIIKAEEDAANETRLQELKAQFENKEVTING